MYLVNPEVAARAAERAWADEHRAYCDRQDALQSEHARNVAAILHAIMSGSDDPLTCVAPRRTVSYTPSELLSEAAHDERAVLLSACRLALFGDDQGAAELLRKFSEGVAAVTAGNYEEVY